MNAKLQQLMDRSFTDHQGERFDLERFAELIVRECADKAHEFIKSDGDEFPLQAVSYRIKQHFGIKE